MSKGSLILQIALLPASVIILPESNLLWAAKSISSLPHEIGAIAGDRAATMYSHITSEDALEPAQISPAGGSNIDPAWSESNTEDNAALNTGLPGGVLAPELSAGLSGDVLAPKLESKDVPIARDASRPQTMRPPIRNDEVTTKRKRQIGPARKSLDVIESQDNKSSGVGRVGEAFDGSLHRIAELTLGSPDSGQPAPISYQGRRVVRSNFARPDGSRDVASMLQFLRAVPTFKKHMQAVDDLFRRRQLLITEERRIFTHSAPPTPAPMYTLTDAGGQSWILYKPEATSKWTNGDFFYMLSQEVMHVDWRRLAALVIRYSHNFPRALLSRTQSAITSGRAIHLIDGYWIDKNLWIYLTEFCAYYGMNQLYDILLANQFRNVDFQGTDHLNVSSIRKNEYQSLNFADITVASRSALKNGFDLANDQHVRSVLLGVGIPPEAIDRLNLSSRINPITAYVLTRYVHAHPEPGSQFIDVTAPYLPAYIRLSFRDMLSGILRRRGISR